MESDYWIVLKETDQILAGPFPSYHDAMVEMSDPYVGEDEEGQTLVVGQDYYFQWGEPEVKYGTPNWSTQILEAKNDED